MLEAPRPRCRVELMNTAGVHVPITPTNHSLLGQDYTVGELACTVETLRGVPPHHQVLTREIN